MHYLIHYRIITGLIGLLCGLVIFILLRRDNLSITYSLWWITIASGLIILGLFPGIVDYLGSLFNIHYPPILLMLISICLILIKLLFMDLDRSKNEKQIRILSQRLAIYEKKEALHKTGTKKQP